MFRLKTDRFIITIVVLVVLGALNVTALWIVSPVFQSGTYRTGAMQRAEHFTFPLDFSSDNQLVDVRFTVDAARFVVNQWTFSVDDCLRNIKVNGISVNNPQLPYCNYSKGIIVDLGNSLRPGLNDIQIELENYGGPGKLEVAVSWTDPLLLMLSGSFITLITLCVVILLRKLHSTKRSAWLIVAVTFGCFLRILYFFQTSSTVRAHDVDGHLEYIRYIMSHWTIPPLKDGWEFFQAPLYYYVSALITTLGTYWGLAASMTLHLQITALCYSIGSLLAAVWIGKHLFHRKGERLASLFFILIVGLTPSIVFFAARINNDVLAHLLAFLTLALIMRWWQIGTNAYLVTSVIMLSFAVLTKTSALLLVPVLFLLLMLRQGLSRRKRIVCMGIALSILLLLTGWYFVLRFGIEHQNSVVANVTNLNGALRVDVSIATLGEFNPIRMIQIPFNNPWSDTAGRQYFWEYFFRSAFFGEFEHSRTLLPLASFLIAFALALMPFMVFGLVLSLRKYRMQSLPLLLTSLILVLGQTIFRQRNPFSTAEDFRHSVILIIPAAYYIALGIEESTAGWRLVGRFFFAGWACCCTLFLVFLGVV